MVDICSRSADDIYERPPSLSCVPDGLSRRFYAAGAAAAPLLAFAEVTARIQHHILGEKIPPIKLLFTGVRLFSCKMVH